MSKLVEAASEFLGRDTFNKGNHRDFSEAMHPMKKKMEAMHPEGMHRMPDGTMMKNSDMPKKKVKKEMEESFLLSQEEFHSLSEDEQEQYVSQLVELKRFTLESSCMGGQRNGMLMSGKMNGMKEMDAKKMKEMKAVKEMDKMKMKRM